MLRKILLSMGVLSVALSAVYLRLTVASYAQSNCAKECGAGYEIATYHRSCDSVETCHVTECSYTSCGGDTYNDYCGASGHACW
jgi:hypothetical protein